MQTWSNKFHLNREGESYPLGPWTAEPDKAIWIDMRSDLDCMIHRNPMGALCGYVGVGLDHPWHGKDYDDVNLNVHGGLTFSDGCEDGDDPAIGICHVAKDGRPDPVWWFGFDCGHYTDLIPGMSGVYAEIEAKTGHIMSSEGFEIYRTFGYVKAEVIGLAKQLAKVTDLVDPT